MLLRSKEAFFAGLAKGCTITADWMKEDRERLNVMSGSAVPPLTKICSSAASLAIRPEQYQVASQQRKKKKRKKKFSIRSTNLEMYTKFNKQNLILFEYLLVPQE